MLLLEPIDQYLSYRPLLDGSLFGPGKTYGRTPARYLTERRVERAQDLLRATNLTVTEVCHAVGFSSLGSFSSRFRELVGETPSEFQRRYAKAGAPRIPGCYIFQWGLAERSRSDPASQEKQDDADPS